MTGLESLAPCRIGSICLQPFDDAETGLPFDGTYFGSHTSLFRTSTGGFIEDVREVRLTLKRNGDEVYGQFDFGLTVGTIQGVVDGDTLHVIWSWAGFGGRGVLTSDGESISGTYGDGEEVQGAGIWTVTRE